MVDLEYLETHLTDHCNLNCKSCEHFSPLSEKKFKDVSEFENEFKQLASMFNLKKIRLMGGEPLLHPNFIEFCRIARKYFPNARIEVVTNGTLLKNIHQYAEEINDMGIIINISNYHVIDIEQAAEPFKYKLAEERDGRMYNTALDLNNVHDPKEMYAKCDLRYYKCFFFQDGYFYLCPIIGNLHIFEKYFNKKFPIDIEENRINIFNSTPEAVYDFLHKECDACKICDIDFRLTHWQRYGFTKKDIYEWINEQKNPYAIV